LKQPPASSAQPSAAAGRRWRAGGEAAAAIAAVLLLGWFSGLIGAADRQLYDWALRAWPRAAGGEVAIVAVDDRSLAALGRWPWSRRIHARLLDRLREAGVAAIGFDVILAEPQGDDPEADRELAAAIAADGRVVLPVFATADPAAGSRMVEVRPLPPFARAAAALGHVDVELDQDAVVRRAFLEAGVGRARWPALALAMRQVALRSVPAGAAAAGEPAVGGAWVRSGEMLIPFVGAAERFRLASYVDVLRDPAAAASLAGKYVLVGATANGLAPGYATPASGHARPLTGVELNANLLDGLVAGIAPRALAPRWSIPLLLALVLLPIPAWLLLDARAAFAATVLVLLATVAASLLLLHVAQAWYAPATGMLAIVAGYPLFTWRRLERTSRSLAEERERSRATLDAIAEAVVVADGGGAITFLNPVGERLSGHAFEQVRGTALAALFEFDSAADREAFGEVAARCLRDGVAAVSPRPLAVRGAGGSRHDLRVSASPVRVDGGAIDGVVLALTDVTETVAMTRSIAHQATHDTLTGLPNRALLHDRLERAMARARRRSGLVAVLFIDLDDFKRVNDGFGHAVGDALLRTVASRLLAALRANDTVARWGGDEFVVVAEDVPDPDTAAAFASKLVGLLQAPIGIDGAEHFITASVGISLAPRDGADADVVVRNADRAMLRAKQQRLNQPAFYSERLNDRALERRKVESGLRRSLAESGFELLYQPQWEADGRTLRGAEALLRWRDGDVLREPARFIDVAEECGLIHDLGAWALRAACAHLRDCCDHGLPPIPVAVNLSRRQMIGRDIVAIVRAALDESGADPSQLKLEITENAVMLQDLDRAATILAQLRALGVRISIDDFGTGYASLTHLRRFVVDEVKIDRSFVRHVVEDAADAAIANGVIAIAHGMERQVVAEGVETMAQFDYLRLRGCDAFQGFYFARPLARPQYLALLRNAAGGGARFVGQAPKTLH